MPSRECVTSVLTSDWGPWSLVRGRSGWLLTTRYQELALISCRTEEQRKAWLAVLTVRHGHNSAVVTGLLQAFEDLNLVGDLSLVGVRHRARDYVSRHIEDLSPV